MRRVKAIIRAGLWPAADQIDRLVLDFDDRHRRRRVYTTEGGTVVLLDMAEAVVLGDGDGLRLEDGAIVAIAAAAEPLVEVTAHAPADLARLAWHLGNRHLPIEIAGDRLLIRDDHVIVDMLKGLGAIVRYVKAPFSPEGGAYGQHNHDTRQHHLHHREHSHDHPHDGHPDHDRRR
ncbi:MAG: urease accessory protein UreE [Rhodospirillales bacterium]